MAAPANGPRIVLGLDYGTTYTGLAWMQDEGNGSCNWENDLKVFRSWPAGTTEKVPSQISYSNRTSEDVQEQWGHSISQESEIIRWTKLELQPRNTKKELEILKNLVKGLHLVDKLHVTNDIPEHLTKDAVDIVADYLSEIAKVFYKHLVGRGRHVLSRIPVDMVITHPASWSYEATNKTFRAVMAAFHPGMFPTLRDVSFISEPEACALYTIQDTLRKDHRVFIPGECFVVCDAGGGTVDLVSYFIESLNPLKLSRVGGVSGGEYGSTFIDRAFIRWLQPKLTSPDQIVKEDDSGGHFVLHPAGKVLMGRFERIKHAYSGMEDGDIDIPSDINFLDDVEGIEDLEAGVLTLKSADMQEMFEDCIKGTIRMIAGQIAQVKSEVRGQVKCRVGNIFLSGGFAQSPYLQKQVKEYASRRGIPVQKADSSGCWSAVVQGAVLRGFGIGMLPPPKVTKCPRHYGVCVSQEYADYQHEASDSVMDKYNGVRVVPKQLFWLIKKGDLILPDTPITYPYSLKTRFSSESINVGEKVRVTFISTAIEDPPTTMAALPTDTNEIVDMDILLKNIPKVALKEARQPGRRRKYNTVDMQVKIRVLHNVRVDVECLGENLYHYETNL